ncbi:MAG: response regulator [Pseudobacteriovorax sp.]|nr:response regulator [Pseudobacteriovorax sp.]
MSENRSLTQSSKILIVEDQLDLAETIADSLEGFDTTIAVNGKEASEYLAVNDIDLVITDIMFPGGGGERVLNELSTRDIPTVVYTGQPAGRKQDFTLLGANEVIFKTQEIAVLVSAVKRLLD